MADNPYPQMVPFLRKIAKENNRKDIVIMTERDPSTWAASRIKNHIRGVDVTCRNGVHAFDLEKCLQTENDPAKLMFRHSDVFVNDKDGEGQYQAANEEYVNFLANAMKKFQRKMKDEHPIIGINLWNEDLPKQEDVSSVLLTRLKNLIPPDVLAQYLNSSALKVEQNSHTKKVLKRLSQPSVKSR